MKEVLTNSHSSSGARGWNCVWPGGGSQRDFDSGLRPNEYV